jgi:hypothetical protein
LTPSSLRTRYFAMLIVTSPPSIAEVVELG